MVFLLNSSSTIFSGPHFEPKCYQAFISPFKPDHSRPVNEDELFLSFPKKSKDKSLVENLSPISLLNVDYKILTKFTCKKN